MNPCFPLVNTYPSNPWGWPYDSELERLRRLERETRNEDEKARLREILRRRGVDESVIQGRGWIYPPLMPAGRVPPPSLKDVLGLIRNR